MKDSIEDKIFNINKNKNVNIKQLLPMFDKQIIKIANECTQKFNKEITAAKVLLRFHIQRNCYVIVKATTEKHLIDNLDVFDWNLNDKQMKRILSLNRNWRCITMAKNSNHHQYPF
eukprot:52310_1